MGAQHQGPLASLLVCLLLSTGLSTGAQADETLLDAPQLPAQVGQCGASSWRGLPLASQPTPNAQFDPLKINYYKDTVVRAVWPAAIGLGFTLLVFLYFLLWRLFRCCCGGCCCCGGRKLRSKLEKIHAARCQATYKVFSLLLLLGTAGGCAYAMAMVNPKLVSEGQATIDATKGFLTGVLDAANGTLLQVEQLDSIIVEIKGVVDTDVNPSDIVAKLEALKPWMAALPNPTTLSGQIVAARALVDNVLTPQLATLNTALGGLLSHLQDSSYSNALGSIVQAQAFVATLTQQAEAITAAVGGLPAPAAPLDGTEGSKLQALSDALLNFRTLPDIPTKVAKLQTLQDSLGVLTTALTSDKFVDVSYDSLGKVMDAARTLLGTASTPGTVPSIGSTLKSMQTTYSAAEPFMAGLLGRVESINANVLALPADLQANVDLLSQAKGTLDDIMAGPNQPSSLADQLTGATAGFALPTSADAAQQQLGDTKAVLASVPDPTTYSQYGWGAAISQLQSLESAMQNLQVAVDGCISANCKATSPGTYATFHTHAGTVAGQLGRAGPLKPAFDIRDQGRSLFAQAGLAKATVDQLSSGQQLQNLQDQVAMVARTQAAVAQVPATGSYTAMLDSFAPTYAALPTPATQLLVDAQSSVQSIAADITSRLNDGHDTIQTNLADVRGQMGDIKLQSVGRIEEYEEEYMPMVKDYDKWRQVGMFVFLGLGMLLAALLWLATFINWPAGLKTATVLLLVLLMLYWLLVIVCAAVMKVGSDGCTNVESQVIMRIKDSSMPDKQKILAAANYFLYNEGRSLEQVLQTAFNVNITGVMAEVNTTRDDLLKKVQPPDGYQLQPLLSKKVDKAVNISYLIQDSIWGLLGMVDYDSINPVYLRVKEFGCCTALDVVGNLWVGLVIMGCCSGVMCVVALSALRAMDKLPPNGCCRCYKPTEFISEPKLDFPAVPDSQPKGGPQPKHQILIAVDSKLSPPSRPYAGSFGSDTPLRHQASFIPAVSASQMSFPGARGPSSALPTSPSALLASQPATRAPSFALPASPSALSAAPSLADSRRELLTPRKSGASAQDRQCRWVRVAAAARW